MLSYKGIFEAHITLAPLTDDNLVKFQHFCQNNALKLIQIELSRGDFALQQMTASVHEGNLEDVLKDVKSIAQKLGRQGFEVKRIKLEASPFNEDLPANRDELHLHSKENYFEHHLKLLLSENTSNSELLISICEKYQAHLSRNAFKIHEQGRQERFVTLRHYGLGRQEAGAILQMLQEELEKNGFQILKTITEYCVYDDHIGLDANWLTSQEDSLHSPCETCNNDCILSPV